MREAGGWWEAPLQHRGPARSVTTYREGQGRGGEGIHTQLRPIRAVIRQKPAQHSKAILLQFKKVLF